MAKRFVTAREQFELLSPWRIAMPAIDPRQFSYSPDGDRDIFSLYDDPENPDYEEPLSEMFVFPHGEIEHIHTRPDVQRQGYATALLDWARRQRPDITHSDNQSEEGALWRAHEENRHLYASRTAAPESRSDRTAAVHDRLMQIVAMADTTPWHPHIEEVGDGRFRERKYIIRKPRPSDEQRSISDQPIAELSVTLHDKGDNQWKKLKESDGEYGYVPREGNEAYINSIIVHPDFQGQGVAQALIERLNSDYPQHKINPGMTTPKGYGLVQRLKKIIPNAEEKISPEYEPHVMDDETAVEYESSEYPGVGHHDYSDDDYDYSDEYNPSPRQLVNASYDDGPYYAMAWDDEDDEDEDEEEPKKHKHHATTELMNAPHYVGVDERMLEKEPAARDFTSARFWHTAMAWQDYADNLDRLYDIAVTRFKMQRHYEENNNGRRNSREPVTAGISDQPDDVTDDFSMAEFYQWCAHNHRKADINALNQYAQVSGMSIQEYEDVLSFLDGQQEDSEELRLGKRTATAPVLDSAALQHEDQMRAGWPEPINGPVLDKPADFPDDWFEQHWGDDDDAPLPVPEQTGPPPRPADKILNEWVKARDSITPENLSDWHAAPWTNPLEETLYKEFQHDWWPGSEAAMVRNPDNVNTGWSFHPDEPITHWLNVEDFLNERYPEAATGGKYGLERVTPMLQRQVDDRMLSPKMMEEYGYIGHGNAITQAMLNLHNKLQGRKWDSPQDRKRYYELMLKHIGPNGKKVSRLAKLIQAMAWDEWAPKVKHDYDDWLDRSKNRRGYGSLYIQHESPPGLSQVTYYHYPEKKEISIGTLHTEESYRNDGVAEALMRTLHEAYPDHVITPGQMSPNGQAFHDRMLEKEPEAKSIVAQANRVLLAMAWQDWAPKIQHNEEVVNWGKSLGVMEYKIPHEDESGNCYGVSKLHYQKDPFNKQLNILWLGTNSGHRNDGLAESLIRRMHEDHPDYRISPGVMLDDGRAFHDRMLEKEPTARELVTAAQKVIAIDMTSPEGRAQIEQLMQMQEQIKKWREGPHENWYHVSPHDLPEGTKLVPGGVGSSATSQDFYDMGFGDDSGNLKDMGGGRPQHVWLTPDLDDAHFWSAALNAPHIYQVDPHETPSPWNGTGTDGFVSPGATIRKKVSGGQ